MALAVSLIFYAGLFQISDGLQVGGFGALRGLKDTRMPMIFNFISYWLIGFSVGYYLGIITDFGPSGLWIGLISGLSVAAICHNTRFHLMTSNAKN
jgi:MATE family multidrug resistance protein